MRLKGLNRVVVKLASGQTVTYWYAWKGGPRLTGTPGSPEFIIAYTKAVAARKAPQTDTLAGLVDRYRGSAEFARNAVSTKAEWNRWLDRIKLADIATLPRSALNDPAVTDDLLSWRDNYADRPRTADYGAQVLSRVMSWSKRRGLIKLNAMEGAETLNQSERPDQIWTPEDIGAFCAVASPEVGRAVRLACVTSLSRSDLVDLKWSEVGPSAIVRGRLKSRKGKYHQTTQTIPLIPEARRLLAEIGRREGHVLLNTRGKPWTADGLESQVIKAKAKAGVNKHLHDARGTFCTRMRLAGASSDDIAAVMGWKKEHVERILAVYVDRDLIVRRIADRLSENES